MKKKFLITILIILISTLILITYTKIHFSKTNNHSQLNTTKTEFTKPKIKLIKTEKFCKDETNCPLYAENIYAQLTFDIKNKEIQQWIDKTNQQTTNYYEEAINSNTETEICNTTKDIYTHRLNTITDYIINIGKEYISLSVKRTKYDLCTKKVNESPYETLLFNIKKNKIITQDDLIKELNLSEELIKNSILQNARILNQEIPLDFNYSNYNLYYNSLNELLVEYQLNNQYYSAIIYI